MALTQEELELRTKGLGGSDAPVVLGLSSYKSRLALYLEKRREIEADPVDSEAALWGAILEDPVAREWSRRTKYEIRRQPTRFSKEHPFMLVNMDRQIMGHPRGTGLAEVKCFSEWKAGRIETLDEVPDAVYVQVQHGLAVTGYAWGVIIILAGGQRLVWFEVDRHEEFITALINAERVFWDAVVADHPPAADAHPATSEALKRLYPQDSGKKIVLDHPHVQKLAHDLSDWKAKAKAAEEEWEARKNAMKLLMGDASELEIPGYGLITWKTSKVSKKPIFDEERFRKEQPELYAKYMTTIPTGGTRTFYDKPKKPEETA